MKKLLLIAGVLLATVSFTSTAAISCGDIKYLSGVSSQKAQEMVVQCEQAKLAEESLGKFSKVKEAEVPTVDQVDQWSKISLQFAKALGVAANELGMAVDGFLDTDAGKLTAVFIGWKIFGDDILGVLGFGLILSLTLWLLTFTRKLLLADGYEEVETTNIFGTKVTKRLPKYITWKQLSDNTSGLLVVSYIMSVVVILVSAINLL